MEVHQRAFQLGVSRPYYVYTRTLYMQHDGRVKQSDNEREVVVSVQHKRGSWARGRIKWTRMMEE